MEEYEKIEIRSEEVQEILGTPPRWIVRWGTTVIILVLLFLFYLSYLIKYPDMVQVPVTITTSVEPVDVVAQRNGQMSRMLVSENEAVSYGQNLIVIQNPAMLEDVLYLDSLAVELQLFSIPEFLEFEPPTQLELGELQLQYSMFVQLFKDLTNDLTSRYDQQRKITLDNEIRSIRASIGTLKGKQEFARNERKVAEKELQVAQKLYASKSISQQDLVRAATKLQTMDRQIQSIKSEVADKEVDIARIESQKVEIGVENDQSQKFKFVELQENINRLKTAVENWKLDNLLIAPIEGTISFNADFRSAQQFIAKDDVVLSIIPKDGERIIGKATLPTTGLGKVAIGNKVIIRVEGYPYEDWGTVKGVLETKGLLPNKNREYPITIELPSELETSIGKELNFDHNMVGVAEIISEDRRFIQRIFNQLRGLFEKYD